MKNSPWRLPFAVNVVFLVLLLISLPYVEPGTATAVITKISFAVVIFMIVVSGVLIRIQWNPFE